MTILFTLFLSHWLVYTAYLHHSFGTRDLQDLSAPLGTIRQGEMDDLCILWKLEMCSKTTRVSDTKKNRVFLFM